MICETTDFTYPLLADVYYPIVEQGAYGNLKRQWVLDRSMACFFNVTGNRFKKDVNTEPNINIDTMILGRTKSDLTIGSNSSMYAITNIVITNVRGTDGQSIYTESAGPRAGYPTIFEVATISPIVGPFGKVEYFKLVLRRSENQAIDV
jgi:hypothetical protein